MAHPTPSPPPTLTHLLTHTTTPLILDGALATYLEALGATLSSTLWSASLLQTSPSLIRQAHTDYYRAGANIAITASYQASIPGLVQHLGVSEDEAYALVQRSVALAREARENTTKEKKKKRRRNLFIAGSIGPYGAYLCDGSEYTGTYTSSNPSRTAFQNFHQGRMAALISSGIDMLALETLPSYPETHSLVSLLNTTYPNTPAYFSFTLSPTSATHISDGTPLSTILTLLDTCPSVVAVGVNCVNQDVALEAIQELKRLTRMPLLVYPNSGEEWNAVKRDWEGGRRGARELAQRSKEYWDAGARMVGGCCRTTPEDIRVIAEALRGVGRVEGG
ncbi:Homocysteine S-methyltransferase [Massarina eburnea CBS 473.64]|uniref:Homocysteine S-methyltransferase n=1 Tax=Massarina eburnea CBS 473.64 TaxID=1395130 RepID=A0A6A6S107_9PLEO|nr:Homocysteine S-methyltransferase [Massarina eburnea CBS 473.64]